MHHQKGVPLYSRIESLLRNKILSGQYEPGKKLPTIKKLSAEFEVSRITVLGALNILQREGLVKGRSGKGIFVSDSVTIPKQFVVTGDVRTVVMDAERYDVKVLEPLILRVDQARIANDLRRFFNVPSDHELTCLRRMRLLKDVPIYFIENFLPTELAQSISTDDLARKPLMKILKEKGLSIGKGEMYLQAVAADLEIAELLHYQTHDPLIHVQVYYWQPSGEPLETASSYMRPDYFKYKADIDATSFRDL